jgi:Dehydrogenases with different specificities (related to short-chain alcohol dehydrogenases)
MSETIFITGANRGIGLALAMEAARSGWTVFATARRPADLRPATADLPAIHPVKLDVLDDASVCDAAEAVAQSTPSLDVLVNNAAIFPGEGNECLEELDLHTFSEAFETNVVGVARVTRAFLPLLRKSSHPRLVNISSGAGSISEKTDYDYYPYSVSKAALNMLTRAVAAELQPEGIVTVAISPGWVKTDMGGPNAPLRPEESAASLFGTIRRLSADDCGKFLGRDGTTTGYSW